MVCGHSRKDISCLLPGICTLVYFNQYFIYQVPLDQAMYATCVVAKYLDTVTVNKSTNFYNTTFPSDMIFTKYVMSKLKILLGNSIFTTDLVFYH